WYKSFWANPPKVGPVILIPNSSGFLPIGL
ncbi:MAG: hypothetical protein ACI857_003105, partial [Arenicella sp.]